VIEADFERSDVGALALALFHGRDDLFAVLAEIAQLIEFGVKAAANDARLGGQRGRFIGDGAFKKFAHIGELVDFVVNPTQKIVAPRVEASRNFLARELALKICGGRGVRGARPSRG